MVDNVIREIEYLAVDLFSFLSVEDHFSPDGSSGYLRPPNHLPLPVPPHPPACVVGVGILPALRGGIREE